MTYPLIEYTAEAGQRDYDVPFPFINRTHVKVVINGIPHVVHEWINDARLRLTSPASSGAIVVVYRATPIEGPLVEFQNGAVLTSEDLNIAVRQLLFRQQELQALYDGTIYKARVRIGEAGGIVITPEDAANQIASLVAADQVLADFHQRIEDIDSNAAQIAVHGITIDSHGGTLLEQAGQTAALDSALNDLRGDHEALVGLVDALANLEDGTGLATIIQNEADQRVAGDTALAATLAVIGAKSGDNSAFIVDMNRVKVSPTESFAQRMSALSAKDGENAAAIQAEILARTNAISAEATARTSLAATLRAETAAAITLEQSARATAISAEATARTQLGTTLRGEFNAAITTEASARSTQDSVFATNFTLMGARNPSGTAWLLDDSKVILTNGQSLVTRLSGLDATIGNTNAAIVNEATARANGDSANASQISVVSSTVNGHTASISTLQSSTNGLLSRWGIQLNANGYISGIVMNNDGSSSDFTVMVDKFRIINAVNGNYVYPFLVEGGVVKINSAYITDLHASRITAGTITADRLVWGGLGPGQLGDGAVGQASAFFADGAINSNSTSVWVNVATVSITPQHGKPLKVDFSCFARCSAESTRLFLRIVRADGTSIYGGSGGTEVRINDEGSPICLRALSGSQAGVAQSFTLQTRKSVNSELVSFTHRLGFVEELSRVAFQQFSISAAAGTGPTGGGGGGGIGYNPNNYL